MWTLLMKDIGLLLLQIVAGSRSLPTGTRNLFSLLLGTAAVSLCLTGPGRISVDHLLSPEES
jgi:hypothetical protein